jgi:hypothetical protein
VVRRTVLAGHDAGRCWGRWGLVVRVARELTGRGSGGLVARYAGGPGVVIARRGIIGAEGTRCCVTGDCRRGALLGPGGSVACQRSKFVSETVSFQQYQRLWLVSTLRLP